MTGRASRAALRQNSLEDRQRKAAFSAARCGARKDVAAGETGGIASDWMGVGRVNPSPEPLRISGWRQNSKSHMRKGFPRAVPVQVRRFIHENGEGRGRPPYLRRPARESGKAFTFPCRSQTRSGLNPSRPALFFSIAASLAVIALNPTDGDRGVLTAPGPAAVNLSTRSARLLSSRASVFEEVAVGRQAVDTVTIFPGPRFSRPIRAVIFPAPALRPSFIRDEQRQSNGARRLRPPTVRLSKR